MFEKHMKQLSSRSLVGKITRINGTKDQRSKYADSIILFDSNRIDKKKN